MASLSEYFVEDKSKLIGNKDNMVTGDKYRFTIMSSRLIRLEYSPTGVFEDRATSLVVNRSSDKQLFWTNP